MNLTTRLTIAALLVIAACGEKKYTWAFAQELDGTFNSNELCRESLAQSLYAPTNQPKTTREAGSNIFLFRGNFQSYRVYAFNSQNECETALTNIRLRQRL